MEALAATAPFEQVSESLLVLQRTSDMVTSLIRAVAASTGGAAVEPPGPRMAATVEPDMTKALVQAARAVLAVATIGTFWIFSAWTAGSMAMTGLAVMMVFFATAENPAQMALTFVLAVALSMVVGFFGMAVVVPQVGDFVPLAAFLALVLIPSGLVMTEPAYAFPAAVFSAFFATQIGLANMPTFDIGPYIDNSIGLLLGPLRRRPHDRDGHALRSRPAAAARVDRRRERPAGRRARRAARDQRAPADPARPAEADAAPRSHEDGR